MTRLIQLIRYRQIGIVSLIYLVFFFGSTFLYVQHQQGSDRKTLADHARLISDDVWAINPAGVENYLRLAMETQYYRSIHVVIPGDEKFIELEQQPPTGLTRLLNELDIIPTKSLEAPITRGDLNIGDIRVVQYVRLIIPLLNLFGLHLLLYLLTLFILFLVDRRKTLEILVRERTQSLLESQGRFHDLVNLLPEIVLETDLVGNISYANNAARGRLGIQEETSTGDNLFDFFSGENKESGREQFARSLKQGTLYQGTLRDHDHNIFPILMRSAPIVRRGNIVGARLILIDITERQQMEQQLNRDRKMKAIGLMAGGVAHDLNNILSGIVSYPELLLMDMDRDNPLYDSLSQIQKAGLEASEVVSDLLTVARGSRGDKELVDLKSLIMGYLESPDFAQIRSRYPLVEYRFIAAPDLLSLSCSPIHIRKCLMNLVINAFEAICGAGEVVIVAENISAEEIRDRDLGISLEERYLRITVTDTGTGIEEKELEHIFEPFYSKKVMGRSGTGLGLTVVWNTVRDHGGLTQVTSSETGSSFELIFPGSEEPVLSEKEGAQQPRQGCGESVLVVDDEARQRDIATTVLKSLGYRVMAVSNQDDALDYLARSGADLVVLDMIMGSDQPNGREVYEKILIAHPEQKAIIASGYAEDDDVRQTLAMGASAFIAKPYTITSMSHAVYNALHSEVSEPHSKRERLPA